MQAIAADAAETETPRLSDRKTHIRVMEAHNERVFSGPEIRLKTLKQSLGVPNAEGLFRVVDFDNLIPLLLEHRGYEDVPVNTYERTNTNDIEGLILNVDDMVVHLGNEKDVFQYVINYIPARIRNRRKTGSDDIPEHWLSLNAVANIKGCSTRTVSEHCRKGNLNCRRFVDGEYYVDPDHKLDYWIRGTSDWGALYRRLLTIKDVLDSTNPDTVEQMFDLASEFEKDSGIRIHGLNKVLFGTFIASSLGDAMPRSVEAWSRRIPSLILAAKIKRDESYETSDTEET